MTKIIIYLNQHLDNILSLTFKCHLKVYYSVRMRIFNHLDTWKEIVDVFRILWLRTKENWKI